ncbi:MAG: Fur family transcriptional regulator [Planctomycetota bacterium]
METHREDRLTQLTRGYAAAGLPVTTQRRALLAVLAERHDHPTVDEIFADLVKLLPEVSRTTVYRSLETLAKIGLINRVEHPGSAVRFDPNTEPHHHFLCTPCGALSDLPLDSLSGAHELAFVGEAPGAAEEISVLVRGTCRSCAD